MKIYLFHGVLSGVSSFFWIAEISENSSFFYVGGVMVGVAEHSGVVRTEDYYDLEANVERYFECSL